MLLHVSLSLIHLSSAGAALAIALPLTVDAVVLYLAVILAGCVVVSIADSFSAAEVDTRLRISGAVAIFTQVGGGEAHEGLRDRCRFAAPKGMCEFLWKP
jgi:acyl-coenzyme A synthetase/AMP-(fatty) acid ligase